ncbi:MAG: YkgJ family cysteine cluster protein [Planctomycetota bacterium]|jgi:Fe-S-cluster containining protein
MSKVCLKCGAKCCTYFCFEIDEPDSYAELEDVRWYLCHDGVTVHVDEGDWYISIENRCKKLGEDDHCTEYEDRPLICRTYSPEKCDFSDGDYGYDEYFETPEQLDAYARKTLGEKAYERAKKRARAKLEAKKHKKTKKRKKK